MDNSSNNSAAHDPASRGLPRRNASREPGKWWTPRGRDYLAQLPRVELRRLPDLVRLEAEAQTRWIVDELAQEIDTGAGLDALRWQEVLGTLVLQPPMVRTPCGLELELGRWDPVLRYIRTGLASIPRETFGGWRAKLAKDPRYALRAGFLKATRLGWGIRGEHRWATHTLWEPSREEYFEAWRGWVQGDAPEPDPVDVVNIGEEVSE